MDQRQQILKLILIFLSSFTIVGSQQIIQVTGNIGLQEIITENFNSNQIIFQLSQSQPVSAILIVCNQKPQFQQISDIYNDSLYGCICDWNSFDTSSKFQSLLVLLNQIRTLDSLPTNTKFTQQQNVYVGVYSNQLTDFSVVYQEIQQNSCLTTCKLNGVCKQNQCNCAYGTFGFDCRYEGINIQTQSYLIKGQYYFLDPLELQSQQYKILFNSKGKLSIQCIAQIPYLQRANQLLLDEILISEEELTNCLNLSNIYQFIPSLFIIQVLQDDLIYIQSGNTSSHAKTILIAVLSTGLTICFCITLCACKYFNRDKSVLTVTNNFVVTMQEQKKVEKSCVSSNLIPIIEFQSALIRYQNLKDEEECQICLDKFRYDTIVKVTYCSHVFHCKCLDAWLKKNKTCPVCRSPQDCITLKQQIQQEKLISNFPSYSQNTELNNEGGSQKRIAVNFNGEVPILQNSKSAGYSKIILSN